MMLLRTVLLVVLTSLAVLAVACGDDDDDPTATPSSETTSTADANGGATADATDGETCETGDADCSGVVDSDGEVDCGEGRTEEECQQIAVDAAVAAVRERASDAEPELVSAVYTRWTDSCLGIDTPGVACAEVITPGYAITLDVNGVVVEYHADFDGNVVRAQ